MKIFKKVTRLPEFKNDLKRLSKKFRTLEEDLEIFVEKQFYLYHKLDVDNKGIVPLSGLGIETPRIFKARKFACRSLKGKGVLSGIRVIYAYFILEDKIELVEIYFKGDKANEDRGRIHKNYQGKNEAKMGSNLSP